MSAVSQRKAVVALVRALTIKPHTLSELSVVSGMEERAVSGWVHALRESRPSMVMIGDWKEDSLGRRIIPAYAWGLCGVDMPKPAPLTRVQITARHRAKKARTA